MASDHASIFSCLVCDLDLGPQSAHLPNGILLRDTEHGVARLSE